MIHVKETVLGNAHEHRAAYPYEQSTYLTPYFSSVSVLVE
jgi:hypothetical protein